MSRGLFGDLAADALARIGSIEGTLALRKKQLQAAIDKGSDKVDVYKRTVDSLEQAIGGYRLEAQQMAEQQKNAKDKQATDTLWASYQASLPK